MQQKRQSSPYRESISDSKTFQASSLRIEKEYIKNLQKQVYLLELESSFLREQKLKDEKLKPAITEEAERMIIKLREKQTEIELLREDNRSKDCALEAAGIAKAKLIEQLHSKNGEGEKYTQQVKMEINLLRREREIADRNCVRSKSMVNGVQQKLENATLSLTQSKYSVNKLQAQLKETESEKERLSKDTEELKAHNLKLRTELQESQDKYFSAVQAYQNTSTDKSQDELRSFRRKLKETELALEQERCLKDKVQKDMTSLLNENASLGQRIAGLVEEVGKERSFREAWEGRKSERINESVLLRDQVDSLLRQLDAFKKSQEGNHQHAQNCVDDMLEKDKSLVKSEQSLRAIY